MKIQHKSNNSVNWNEFNPELYLQEHYARILPPDEEILTNLVSFYKGTHPRGLAMEVGCGPNLYPVFAILPYIDHIDIMDYSAQNIIYLKKQLISFEPLWQQWVLFLRTLAPDIYTINFQKQLQEKAMIYQKSIFDLPQNKYDAISMHFVAESLTGEHEEFDRANKKFIGALKPGGIFAASFTENSQGYSSPGKPFPAVAITEKDIERSFRSSVQEMNINKIHTEQTMFQTVHTGILTATGFKKRISPY